MIDWLKFIIAILATWRLTYLIVSEDGPFSLIFKLRRYLADSYFGELMDCFGCASIWVAIPLTFFVTTTFLGWIVVWLALSGGALLLENFKPTSIVVQPILEKE